MLQTEYKKDMQNSYMMIQAVNRKQSDASYCLKMLLNNTIKGFLPLEIRQYDDEQQYWYETNGGSVISVRFEREKLSYYVVEQIILELISTVNRSRVYLLREDDFVISPEHVFISDTDCHIRLCYLPGYGIRLQEQIAGLLEFFMNKVDYNDKKAVLFVYTLYTKSKEKECTFNQILKKIQEQKEAETIENKIHEYRMSHQLLNEEHPVKLEQRSDIINYDSIKSEGQERAEKSLKQAKLTGQEKLAKLLKKDTQEKNLEMSQGNCQKKKLTHSGFLRNLDIVKKVGLKGMFSKKQEEYLKEKQTEKLTQKKVINNEVPEEEKTQLLAGDRYLSQYYLKPVEEGEDIYLTKSPFYIGKADANVNKCIPEKTISRLHAKIIMQEEGCYIEDLRSTNGSFVNGYRLDSCESKRLEPGDEVTFAERKYTFTRL